MDLPRASGILLHPTSLSSSSGIGTLGEPSYNFIDWLVDTKQSLWQMLPIGPTGYGDSPYASISSFAGNPLLIDLHDLVQKGFLQENSYTRMQKTVSSHINFPALYAWKEPLLEEAARAFLQSNTMDLHNVYTIFKNQNKFWLDDYVLYTIIKRHYNKKAQSENIQNSIWFEYWHDDLKKRNESSIEKWKSDYSQDIEIQMVIQFFFFEQWTALRSYAKKNGVFIIGDIPIFVSSDSADLWANQELFHLTPEGKPEYVAGVPPDYFSKTGQRWGNPLYKWDKHLENNYVWWKTRIKHMMSLFDYIRIDHFRGFESYWAIPAEAKTAETGSWEKGPGFSLFSALKEEFGELRFIAEDLGVITKEVEILRDSFSLPGMKIFQFAFTSDELKNNKICNAFLPHLYSRNCVVYTGTHDNDTTLGWLQSLDPFSIKYVKKYLQTKVRKNKLVSLLISRCMSSVAAFAIFPIQDILRLPTQARMNTPSTVGTNWMWRLSSPLRKSKISKWLAEITILYSRNLVESE